ncbi:MAG: ATP-binding protein [Candidatus Omnitrophica bacterium]|nr:ATP-binding protein [Candidatus Omnitrophota bacterium]
MKIANKISLLFLIPTIAFTFITSLAIYLIAKSNLQSAIYSQLGITAEENVRHIETYLELIKISIAQFSKSVVLENFLITLKDAPEGDKEAFGIAMKRLRRTKEVNPEVYEFLLLDSTGRIVASSNEHNIGIDKSADIMFTAGQKGLFIKDAYYSEELKERLITTSAPISDSQTGKLLGVLAARVKLSGLDKIALDTGNLSRTEEVYIVNKYGYMVTPSLFLKDTFLKQKVDVVDVKNLLLRQGQNTASLNRANVVLFSSYLGVKVLGTYRYIPEMQWYVFAEIDEKEAFAPLVKLRILFLLILFIVPFSAYLLEMYLAKLVTEPIHKLHKGTEIIGRGNLDYKVGTDVDDEIGQLSRAFDTMTVRLKTSTTSLKNLNLEIIERKRAQEGLRQAAVEWQRTFDSMEDMIFIQDRDYNIIKANKSFLDFFKLKPEDVVGVKCFELVHHLGHPWPNCPFAETRCDLKAHTEEVDDPGLGGVMLLITTSPIFEENGEFFGCVHIARNITRLKKYQQELEVKNKELEKLDKLKSEFVSIVSHELRTPLSITKEGISLILDGVVGDINPKQNKILITSKNNIDRLARIINSLLDISRIESGKMELKNKNVDLKNLIANVVALFALKVKEKGLELRVNLPQNKELSFYIDEDKLIQVFTNLIDNSFKFTEKGYICISLIEKEDELEFAVTDTGIGIAPENLPKVFNKFMQFGRTAGAGEKGTGLGLSIAKGLVELYGGRIWVESEVGRGSKFIFTLPKHFTDKISEGL